MHVNIHRKLDQKLDSMEERLIEAMKASKVTAARGPSSRQTLSIVLHIGLYIRGLYY